MSTHCILRMVWWLTSLCASAWKRAFGQMLTCAPAGFLIRGDAGLSVRVQRSANLCDWEDWQTLTLGASASEVFDLDDGAFSSRFYRAVTP